MEMEGFHPVHPPLRTPYVPDAIIPSYHLSSSLTPEIVSVFVCMLFFLFSAPVNDRVSFLILTSVGNDQA